MFEVEQCEYEKEQIDWSYIKFNDNKVSLFIFVMLNYRTINSRWSWRNTIFQEDSEAGAQTKHTRLLCYIPIGF